MRKMGISIIDFVNAIKKHLDLYFAGCNGLAYHSNSDPNSGENTAIPTVYPLLIPSGALDGAYPSHCPAIVITVDDQTDDGTYNITLHLCVAYAAISEKEKVKPVDGVPGRFEYQTDEGYDTNSDLELIQSAIRFSEDVYKAVTDFSETTVYNITVTMPDPTLPDYPYCVSEVRFGVKPNLMKIGQYRDYNSMY